MTQDQGAGSPGGARVVTDAAELARVHTLLLAPAFPPSELEPVEWLVEGVGAGAATVVVTDDDNGPVAVAVTEQVNPEAVLLAYFATRGDARGRGVGSRLYSQMLERVRRYDHPTLVLAEVERPDRHAGSEAHGDPAARLRFYGRLGARVLDLPYFQPPLAAGADPVHGMLLLALWVDPTAVLDDAAGSSVPGLPLVAPAVTALVGDDTGRRQPEAAALLAAARVPRVRLYGVEDYGRVASSR